MCWGGDITKVARIRPIVNTYVLLRPHPVVHSLCAEIVMPSLLFTRAAPGKGEGGEICSSAGAMRRSITPMSLSWYIAGRTVWDQKKAQGGECPALSPNTK